MWGQPPSAVRQSNAPRFVLKLRPVFEVTAVPDLR